jgi:phospholipid/cholesterol/gamma-HCH transport system substrate-binding protein
VDPNTPLRADTQVRVDFQGLMGTAAISLNGGSPHLPLLATSQNPTPILVADAAAGQDLTQAARQALARIDRILAENSEGLHTTISNLSTFSDALARNSGHVDAILAGLEKMTGGSSGKASAPIYDLTAPRSFPPNGKPSHGQLVVTEPNVLVALDTQKILVRSKSGGLQPLDNAQWADSLPKLFQAKIIQSFENSNYFGAVVRPLEGLNAEHQLILDVWTFQISIASDPMAEIEFSAKILASNGEITGTRLFRASAPAKSLDVQACVAALDEAFGKVAVELVTWTVESL